MLKESKFRMFLHVVNPTLAYPVKEFHGKWKILAMVNSIMKSSTDFVWSFKSRGIGLSVS